MLQYRFQLFIYLRGVLEPTHGLALSVDDPGSQLGFMVSYLIYLVS